MQSSIHAEYWPVDSNSTVHMPAASLFDQEEIIPETDQAQNTEADEIQLALNNLPKCQVRQCATVNLTHAGARSNPPAPLKLANDLRT